MNDQRPVKRQPSLLERAADMFGLDPAKNASTIDVSKLPPEPEKRARKAKAEQKRRVEEDPAEKQRLADLEDWERRQHEELMAKYGGEDV